MGTSCPKMRTEWLAQPLTCFAALSLSTFWFYISQKYVAIENWELPTKIEDKAIDLAVSG